MQPELDHLEPDVEEELGRLNRAPSSASPAYVALGDSYSAGTGAAPLSVGWCPQAASFAWPQYVANWLGAAGLLPGNLSARVACSGYTIAQVRYRQLDQLSQETKWITITVGGNDVGFAKVIKVCVGIDENQCIAAVREAHYLITLLAGKPHSLI